MPEIQCHVGEAVRKVNLNKVHMRECPISAHNLDDLWTVSHGSKSKEVVRLREALEKAIIDDTKKTVFTDVLVHVSLNTYVTHRDTLKPYLEEQHKADFFRRLHKNRQPEYRLIPVEGMADDSIRFFFGHYVFFGDDSTLLYSLDILINGESVLKHSAFSMPKGIYENQLGFRFGLHSPYSIDADDWGDRRKYTYIDITANQVARGNVGVRLSSGPFKCIEWTNDAVVDIAIGVDESITWCQGAPKADDIVLRLTRLSAAVPEDTRDVHDVVQREENFGYKMEDFGQDSEKVDPKKVPMGEAVAQEHGKPVTKIIVDGVLLPRLYTVKKPVVDACDIALDKWGNCLPANARKEDFAFQLRCDRTKTDIMFKQKDHSWKKVSTLSKKVRNYLIAGCVPPDLQSTFQGMLRVRTVSWPLYANTPVTLGRSPQDGTLKEGEYCALNHLESCSVVTFNDKKTFHDLANLHTSRKHATIEILEANKVRITQQSMRRPVYILNNQYQIEHILVGTAKDGLHEIETTQDKRLIVGTYVLHFGAA